MGPPLLARTRRGTDASNDLLDRHDAKVLPISHPRVARSTERLRITPAPLHDDAGMDHLADTLVDAWRTPGVTARLAAK